MPLDTNQLRNWEKLIGEVSATEVPLECIKKVLIKLEGSRQRTVNLESLKRQGLAMPEIEDALIRILNGYGDQVRNLEYVIDAATVAEMVQPETDKLLEKLK
jgi:hypothetical protein